MLKAMLAMFNNKKEKIMLINMLEMCILTIY